METGMTDHLDTSRDVNEQSADSGANPEHGLLPWHRPVVTRIPLAVTLAGTGSITDGFMGSMPS